MVTTPREDGRDLGRREIAARGLTASAVAHLTRDALGRIDLSALAPVKGLLKRFFSSESWNADDDAALAELVGPGEGWWQHAWTTGSGSRSAGATVPSGST